MPELPEVQTVVSQLNKRILHHKISKVVIKDTKVVDEIVNSIIGSKVLEVSRHGKYIIIALSNNFYLLVHLGMTGHFHFVESGELEKKRSIYEKYAVAFFNFDNGSLLTYNSIRKFERIKLLTKEQLNEKISRLGPDFLSKEFTFEKFEERLKKRKNANIKTLLMDQKVFAGIGNIYAQEVLYITDIDPRRKVSSLSNEDIKNIHFQAINLLKNAILHKGSTVDNYSHMEGSGDFQNYLAVYGKKSCPKGHSLKKINIGGRGTYFCPICQK